VLDEAPPPPPPVCAGVELCAGAELCVAADEIDDEETDVLATDDPLAGVLERVGVVLVFGLGFLAGATSAGTAPALANGVMEACCALAELDWTRDPAATGGADVFLTADPMANAARSPTTNATARSIQRLRTS
jgi:hypothetical protein